MRLVIFSHKPCWSSDAAPTGFATDGGFPFQVAALSALFDETILVVPVYPRTGGPGEIPLSGERFRIVPLSPPYGSGLARKLLFPVWLLWMSPTILKAFFRADAVHAPIPGDVGTVGMLLAYLLRKPLFVRHCGNWLKPVTVAEKFWRWFMETSAGGRNIMLATGGAAESPSQKNPNVRWIFSTSLTQAELDTYACQRTYPLREPIVGPPGFGVRQPSGALEQLSGNGKRQGAVALQDATAPKPGLSRFNAGDPVRLIIVARQEKAKGAGIVIQALPLIATRFGNVSLDIVGEGSAIAGFKQLAAEEGVAERVHFPGKLNHEQVMQRLREAHLFVFPTTSSDGFPKAVLEGLASGLPVLATRVSVLPQLLGNGCGVLIDEATPEAVACGIEQALSDSTRYEAMSRKAIETARQYSLEAWRDTIGAILEAAWGTLKGKDERGNLKPEKGKAVFSSLP